MPLEYVSEWEVFRMLDKWQVATDSRWYRRTTSVVPPCGSAHILQNNRLSVQHVASQYRGSGKKLRSDHCLKYQHQNNTLTTVQPLSRQFVQTDGANRGPHIPLSNVSRPVGIRSVKAAVRTNGVARVRHCVGHPASRRLPPPQIALQFLLAEPTVAPSVESCAVLRRLHNVSDTS